MPRRCIATPSKRKLAGDPITSTLGTVGKQLSATAPTAAQIKVHLDAMAEMFCAYIERIARDRGFDRPLRPLPSH